MTDEESGSQSRSHSASGSTVTSEATQRISNDSTKTASNDDDPDQLHLESLLIEGVVDTTPTPQKLPSIKNLRDVLKNQLVKTGRRTVYTQTDFAWKKMALRWGHGKIMQATFLSDNDLYREDPNILQMGFEMVRQLAIRFPGLNSLTDDQIKDLAEMLISLRRTGANIDLVGHNALSHYEVDKTISSGANMDLAHLLHDLPRGTLNPMLMEALTEATHSEEPAPQMSTMDYEALKEKQRLDKIVSERMENMPAPYITTKNMK